MKNYVDQFSSDLRKALELPITGKIVNNEIQNVLIAGLGGSGIGATIASQLLSDELSVPVVVSKDYSIPAFISKNTVVLISSYSGNTEETLEALEKAQKTEATIACITSGGEILQIAKENNYPFVELPDGYPPRAAFGWSFTQVVRMLHAYGLTQQDHVLDLRTAADHMDKHSEEIQDQAKSLAAELKGKTAMVYADSNFEGVAWRWRQQLNENAKMLCSHHALPEMNHNELVGWREKNENVALVVLRNETDYYRTQKRFDFTEEVAKQYAGSVHEVWSKGDNKFERALYLILFGDYVSVFIAELKGIDPVEVNIIDKLKGMLSEI